MIHAVGPVHDYDPEPDRLLASAYVESLRRASEADLRSLSFVSLSTGAFAFPLSRAAPIAIEAIGTFLVREHHRLDRVRMVLYPRERPEALSVYARALTAWTEDR